MDREAVVEILTTVLPNMYKRLFRGMPSFDISHQQAQLLFWISKEDGMTMSFYSEKTMISKPNLTLMADKLIEEGFVVRGFDKGDRRIITLNITEKGLDQIKVMKEKVKQIIMQRLGNLKDEDIAQLSHHLKGIKQIIDKVDLE